MIGEGHCAKAASPRVARRDVVAGIAVLPGEDFIRPEERMQRNCWNAASFCDAGYLIWSDRRVLSVTRGGAAKLTAALNVTPGAVCLIARLAVAIY